jgi:Flp pilus assembly protein TadD
VRRALSLGAVAVGVVFALSACSQQSGQNLARQACTHVNQSVHDFELSSRPGLSAVLVAQLRTKADAELRAALPLAAQANSDDGSWNSLMTTISEDATVDEGHLVPALRAQCALANSNVNVNPQNSNPQNSTPQTSTPQNVNPEG